jgi:hypothetical protein
MLIYDGCFFVGFMIVFFFCLFILMSVLRFAWKTRIGNRGFQISRRRSHLSPGSYPFSHAILSDPLIRDSAGLCVLRYHVTSNASIYANGKTVPLLESFAVNENRKIIRVELVQFPERESLEDDQLILKVWRKKK